MSWACYGGHNILAYHFQVLIILFLFKIILMYCHVNCYFVKTMSDSSADHDHGEDDSDDDDDDDGCLTYLYICFATWLRPIFFMRSRVESLHFCVLH